MAVQHHFVVYGVEAEDGSITFEIDNEAATFPEGTLFDTVSLQWRELRGADETTWDRDDRISGALWDRLHRGSGVDVVPPPSQG